MKPIIFLIIIISFLSFYSCDTTESDPENTNNTDIPADPDNITPPVTSFNNISPTVTFQQLQDNPMRIKANVHGVINPVTNQPLVLHYNKDNPLSSNIFIVEDNKIKGLKVSKVSTGNVLQADIVFTVDNSGSMAQEADSIASSIIKFAEILQNGGLEVKFGVVGFSGVITGGLNLTDAQSISNYLNRSSGTTRTVGFAGADSAELEMKSWTFAMDANAPTGENSVVAILFADSNYSWRDGAQRVFINFTDESTQSNGIKWNTAHLCSAIAGKATVHTVFSQDTTLLVWNETHERPWAMAECTGGTAEFISSTAEGLDLTSLPVAGTLSNSYLVEYVKGSSDVKERVVKVIIKTDDSDGARTYNIVY